MSYCNFFGWFQFLQVTTSQNVFACKFTKNELCVRFYYKVGQGFLQVGRCYKMGQFLLQSWAGITKWDNYYKAGQSNNHFHYNNFVRVTYGFNFEPLRFTAWKVSKYGVFSGLCFAAFGLNSERYAVYLSVFSPYFPAFRLNTERYFVSLRIQSECGKYGPEKTPYLDIFHAVLVPADMISSETMIFINNWL